MKRYFDNVNTLEQLRSQYKQLLKQYHPDNKGGSEEATKEINAEYEALFQRLKDVHDTKQDANESNKYNWENDKALREVLQKIINFSGIEIELVGSWVWLDGDTYQYRKELKEMGFKWASQKKRWYFHTELFRKTSNKKLSMNDIRNYYGSTKVQAAEEKRLLQA